MKDIPLTGKVTGKPYNDILSLLNNLRDPIHAKQFVELLSSASSTDGNDAIDPSLSMNLIEDDDAITLAAMSATQVQAETIPPFAYRCICICCGSGGSGRIAKH